MADERTLFERLDAIEATEKANNELLSQFLNTRNQQQDPILNKQNQIQQQNDPRIIKTFLKQSKKCIRWFGDKKQFNNAKMVAIIANLVLIAAGIVVSIVSTICFKLYSTFTFFEDIWAIFGIVLLTHLFSNKFINEVNDLARHSPSKYQRDEVGMLYPTKTKTSFRIFKWLAIVSVICNVVCIWTELGKSTKIFATVMEVIYLGAIIFALIATSNFYLLYSIPWIEGCNLTTGEKVVLVLPPGSKTLMLEEDFKKEMPFFYE